MEKVGFDLEKRKAVINIFDYVKNEFDKYGLENFLLIEMDSRVTYSSTNDSMTFFNALATIMIKSTICDFAVNGVGMNVREAEALIIKRKEMSSEIVGLFTKNLNETTKLARKIFDQEMLKILGEK